MKDDNLKSSDEKTSVNNGELPEVKVFPVEEELDPNIVSHEEFDDDDVIVYLDEEDSIGESEESADLLSHRPGEDDVLTEFERLPEVKATIVDGIPEVVNVEEITSLVSDEVDSGWAGFLTDKSVYIDRCKEFIDTHRKWIAAAAAILLVVIVATWGSGSNASNSSASATTANATAEVFDQWIDQAVSGHLLEIGEKK